jgi:protein-S-isoprenylcysteine O-methyltransferase Ste14
MFVSALLALAVLIAAAVFVISRMRAEFASRARLTLGTAAMVYALWGAHAALVGWAAWGHRWPVPLSPALGWALGGLLAAAGLVFFAAGLIALGSQARISGLKTDVLITSGPYAFSRNPQYAGWMMALTGGALVGRSGFALLVVALGGGVLHVYLVRVEEPFLERRFGEHYRAYRAVVARYVGSRGATSPTLR